jgi:hypothetical protein
LNGIAGLGQVQILLPRPAFTLRALARRAHGEPGRKKGSEGGRQGRARLQGTARQP